MFLKVTRRVDVTPLTDRLDAIEARGALLAHGLVYALLHIIMHNLDSLAHAQDGDPYIDADGTQLVWSDDLAAQVTTENDDLRAIIAGLES